MFFKTSLAYHYVDSKSESKTLSRLFVIGEMFCHNVKMCSNTIHMEYSSYFYPHLRVLEVKKKKEIKLKGAVCIFDN